MSTGLLLALVAAAGPQWGTKEETVYHRGRNLVIALDVSRSMLATDVHPNRLERAKADVLDLIRELRGDRAAILPFRHKAVLLCPLTTDYAFLKQTLDAIDIHSAPRGGTDIGDAISKAIEALGSEDSAHNAIILISDGEDLTGSALRAAETARNRNIPIFTVGLGSRQGARIPLQQGGRDYVTYKGKEVMTRIQHETLHAIAAIAGGVYIPVETASMTTTTLGTLYRDHLKRVSAQDIEEMRKHRYMERYQGFLFPGLVLMLMAAFLSRGRLASERPKPTGGATAAARSKAALLFTPICVLVVAAASTYGGRVAPDLQGPADVPPALELSQHDSVNAQAPHGREGARLAQKLHAEKKYIEAATIYLKAAKEVPVELRRDLLFNAAVALYEDGKYVRAVDIFANLTDRRTVRRVMAGMGLGAALYRAAEAITGAGAAEAAHKTQLLREAGETFKAALRIQSDNQKLRRNLAVVLRELPEAEQKAKLAKLIARYGKATPFDVANDVLINQRSVIEGVHSVFGNDSPSMIEQAEDLADTQKANTDLLLVLNRKLENAATRRERKPQHRETKTIDALLASAGDNMRRTTSRLLDIDSGCHKTAVAAEDDIYRIWKTMAPYREILEEDLRRQTNAMSSCESALVPSPERLLWRRTEQKEALALTFHFTEEFSAAVPGSGTVEDGDALTSRHESAAVRSPQHGPSTQRPADDAGTPTTVAVKNRQRILKLAAAAVSAQDAASRFLEQDDLGSALAEQHRGYQLLKEMRELLPEDKGNDSRDKEQEASERKPPQEDEERQPQERDDISQMLEKALEREEEHKAETRRRRAFIPLVPGQRDW